MNKSFLATEMCVSRSSLYYKSKMTPKDEQLKQEILAVWELHPAYGHRRLALQLHSNKKRIRRVMKLYALEPPIKRKKKHCNFVSSTGKNIYEDWLKKLCPLQANVCWASDFTYLWFEEKWVYMATIIDIHTRELVGVAFSHFHNQELIMEALKDALKHRPAPQYLHSDQGTEYCAETYILFVQSCGITISQSPKGKPWRNGFQESFYDQFKLELGPLNIFESESQLLEGIYLQLHYYNHQRIHLSLKMPPALFAARSEKILSYTAKHLQLVST
jgi:transposase InsO family protein